MRVATRQEREEVTESNDDGWGGRRCQLRNKSWLGEASVRRTRVMAGTVVTGAAPLPEVVSGI